MYKQAYVHYITYLYVYMDTYKYIYIYIYMYIYIYIFMYNASQASILHHGPTMLGISGLAAVATMSRWSF